MRPSLCSLVVVAVLSGASCLVTLDLGYDLPEDGTGGAGGVGGAGGAGVCVPGAVEPCYTGPEGTDGVGLCRAGTMTCKADGSGFEACQGEILPAVEDCAAPTDEDCDGFALPCSGTLLWARSFGDAQDQRALSVGTAEDGRIITSGELKGSANFGGGTVTSQGATDLFVAVLDGNGNHLRSTRFGNVADQTGARVGVRPDGSYVLAGNFRGTVNAAYTHLSQGETDVLVAQMDAQNAPVWSQSFGGSSYEFVVSPVVDATGSTFIAGHFNSQSINAGSGAMPNAGLSDIFVAKYDAAGALAWSAAFGDSENQTVWDLASDNSGNVIVAGPFKGSLSFGSDVLMNDSGGNDYFLAKFNGSGDPVWSKKLASEQADYGISVAADVGGNIVLGVSLEGTIDFGGGPQTSAGLSDICIVKLDKWGNHLWSRRFGDAVGQYVMDVAVDAGGNVLVTGYYSGTVDFGGGPLIAASASDAFVAKFDPGGSHVWSRRMGAASGEHAGLGVAADGFNAIVVGSFTGSMAFDGMTTLTSAGANDIFVAKFAP